MPLFSAPPVTPPVTSPAAPPAGPARTDLPPGLILIHGNRPERLRDLLVGWMQRYPLAPLENEVLLVQSNGIAQWLRLALAGDVGSGDEPGGCGIAAALELSLPARFLWTVYRAVLGPAAVPQASPFDKDRLVWRLMRLLPSLTDRAEYAPLLRFLDGDTDRRKRFQLASRLADLFDQYQVYRADWLEAWGAGHDHLIDARGQVLALPSGQGWQAALWRALLADVGQMASRQGRVPPAGRAAVHAEFLHRAAQWPAGERPPGLPRRIMVFGISSLPRQSLEVIAALSRWTQVLMCVHNPCEFYWADIVAGKDLLRARRSRQRRRPDTPDSVSDERLHLHAQPLLAAWGKQGRDFIGLLDEHDSEASRDGWRAHLAAISHKTDLFEAAGGANLLQQLQDDILALRPLAETRQHWDPVDARTDRSIRFHLAHSAQREVEILHDQLLAAFDADPDLWPRDILVMVPDIDVYVPHIQAVFGLLDAHDRRHIPFSLADRGQRGVDPLVGAIERLIALPQSRVTVGDVLDLLEVPALRRRFGIAQDELPTLQRWIRGANIRWGLHTAHRASLGLPADESPAAPNSWLFGMRRLLLGYAAGDDAQPWHGIEPHGEIGGLDAAVLGPLTQLLQRLEQTWQTLREPAPVTVWCERLNTLLDDFLDTDEAADGNDAFTVGKLRAGLQGWQDACEQASLDEALPLSVVGDHWLGLLDSGGLSQRFFAGAVTFATLMPMRAIPFRRVCLLGMNDGDYPRARIPMDFDLMADEHRPGDRSRREDDRYLFLEALLSARDHLHVSWVARSIQDNSPRPPSVLVGQLRDHLASGWRLADPSGAEPSDGQALVQALTVSHPLQAFSADYFPAQPGTGALFTYAREWRGESRGEVRRESPHGRRGEPGDERAAAAPSAGDALLAPLRRDEPLSLRELGEFLKSPVKAFFAQRLNIVFGRDDPAADDQEPFELDGLSRWQMQEELIGAQLLAVARGEDPAAVRQARLTSLHRRGALAAGGFGLLMDDQLVEPMQRLFQAYQACLDRWPDRLPGEQPVRLTIGEGEGQLVLEDWVGELRGDAQGARARVVVCRSSLVDGQKHYRADQLAIRWVDHLAAQLTGTPVTTCLFSGRGNLEWPPLPPQTAQAHLITLMQAWQQGMRRPLPLAVQAGFAWLTILRNGDDFSNPDAAPASVVAKAHQAAQKAYEGGYQKKDFASGEVRQCECLRRSFPDYPSLQAGGEFATLARALLGPLRLSFRDNPKSAPAASSAGDTR